eukprot:PITA_25232
MKEIKQQMSLVFEMKDPGELRYCLGLEIWRDSGKKFMSQGKYVKVLREIFRMDQCKAAAVPLQQNIKIQNLAYAVSVLSQYMSKPLESHWNTVKCVLRYLQGTIVYGIIYIDSSDIRLTGFTDSDWAGIVDNRRSITDYAFIIGSGVITWSNKKHNTVSLSSTEAEYQAMCATTCEAVWLQRLLQDVEEEQKYATTIRCDNQSSIKLANNSLFHKNTKHIDTQFHFVYSKEIHLVYCNTCDNVADIFTKPLGKIKLQMFREMLGIFVNPFSIKGEC